MTGYGGTPRPDGWRERRQPLPSLGFWSNADGSWPTAPRDAFAALGAGHEILLVIPSLDLVLVRFGGMLGRDKWDGDFWERLEAQVVAPLMDALASGPPAPPAAPQTQREP